MSGIIPDLGACTSDGRLHRRFGACASQACLDEKEETWRRRWAAEWLRKVFPAFRLWVLPPRPEPLTKQEQFRRQLTRGRYERQNREEAERFLEFWDKQKDARGRDGELRSIR